MNLPTKFLQIKEHGDIIIDDIALESASEGQEVLRHLAYLENRSFTTHYKNNHYIVEVFDQPLIVESIELESSDSFKLIFNYDLIETLPSRVFFKNLCLDFKDRLLGENTNGIPFVFSDEAHHQFIDLMDIYDDDFIVFKNTKYPVPNYFTNQKELDGPLWWQSVYKGDIETISNKDIQNTGSSLFSVNPAWSLSAPNEALKNWLPKLKLPKSKILVVGSGDSYDAALLAEQGHAVTAIDITSEAIERARQLHGHLPNLKLVQADIFNLPKDWDQQFDLLYEYTCLCAINPNRRKDLIKSWSRCLHSQGQLLATLFCMHKRDGPPFGGSEWEYRELLKNQFQILLWQRFRGSPDRRLGRELNILAKKRNL